MTVEGKQWWWQFSYPEAKVVTARFFCEQLLPPAVGLVNAVRAGADTLFVLSPTALAD